jgi:poly(3-hydroxybutyrate) depolymerase
VCLRSTRSGVRIAPGAPLFTLKTSDSGFAKTYRIGLHPRVKSKTKKIIVGLLAIVIGVPVALLLTAFACFYIMDKTNGAIISSGVTRRYLIYVPRIYDQSKAAPLVISMHPGATWPAVQMNISRWNGLAGEHGFIVVYPAGMGAFFDGNSPGPHVFLIGPVSLEQEVRFISELIDRLQPQYNIDSNRIYANGMSNGGGMAFALLCKLSDRIAAVGTVAAELALSWDRCGYSKPVPTIVFHDTADKFAPYQGGRSPITPRPLANVPDWAADVAQRNRCKAGPIDKRFSERPSSRLYELR